MGRAFWWIIFLTLGLMVLVAGLPLYKGWAFDGTSFKFDAFGTWLQGSLTPIAILAALVGVGIQVRSQQASNRLAALALVAANTNALADHLNYKAAAAVAGRRLSAGEIEMYARLHFVQQLINDPSQTQSAALRAELIDDLNSVINMAEDERASFLLDRRLIQLRDVLK